MIFKTESGSTYEVDALQKRVRRLYGKLNPTPNQSADGEWKPYDSISKVEVGMGVMFAWSVDAFSASTTYTSNVVEIDPDFQKNGN